MSVFAQVYLLLVLSKEFEKFIIRIHWSSLEEENYESFFEKNVQQKADEDD